MWSSANGQWLICVVNSEELPPMPTALPSSAEKQTLETLHSYRSSWVLQKWCLISSLQLVVGLAF